MGKACIKRMLREEYLFKNVNYLYRNGTLLLLTSEARFGIIKINKIGSEEEIWNSLKT